MIFQYKFGSLCGFGEETSSHSCATAPKGSTLILSVGGARTECCQEDVFPLSCLGFLDTNPGTLSGISDDFTSAV